MTTTVAPTESDSAMNASESKIFKTDKSIQPIGYHSTLLISIWAVQIPSKTRPTVQ